MPCKPGKKFRIWHELRGMPANAGSWAKVEAQFEPNFTRYRPDRGGRGNCARQVLGCKCGNKTMAIIELALRPQRNPAFWRAVRLKYLLAAPKLSDLPRSDRRFLAYLAFIKFFQSHMALYRVAVAGYLPGRCYSIAD